MKGKETQDGTKWSPYDDMRTNAELRARWSELGKLGNSSRTIEEAQEIIDEQDRINYELGMRRLAGMPEDWVNPRHTGS